MWARPEFPFTAVVGQDRLKTALILAAIEPRLAGVLISGPRGAAKSTLARGIAEIDRRADGRFVTLPLGATEEQVIGTLDLARALADGEVAYRPGLIGRAHGGYLYIDEVNLLADPLVDVLLDVAASGVNRIERDGISRSHAAEFVLIGTMNPDEGELRPQFSDRFGLCVELETRFGTAERREIVEQRLRYEHDPEAFVAAQAAEQAALAERIEIARERLADVTCPEAIKDTIAERCLAAGVEGVRADIHWRQAAGAHAAWHGWREVSASDVDAVVEFVLCHRRTEDDPAGGCNPPPTGGSQNSEHGNDPDTGESDMGEMPPRRVAPQSPMAMDAARLAPADAAYRPAETALAGPNRRAGARPSRSAAALAGKPGRRVDWFRTLAAPAVRGTAGSRRAYYRPAPNTQPTLNCVLLDTSASTLGRAVQAEARAAVVGIARNARRAREQFALLVFGQNRVDWLIAPRRAPMDCSRQLEHLPAGGGTPLRAALMAARRCLDRTQRRQPGLVTRTLLLTDGRCRDRVADLRWETPLIVLDMERARVPLGRARHLAEQLGGRYRPVRQAAIPLS